MEQPLSQTILSLGVAPAMQRTMTFESFNPGAVNRACSVVCSAAGKAVNVGLALSILGKQSVVTGFNGGATGAFVASELRRRGIGTAFTRIDAPTRTCTTVVDLSKAGESTELVEESPRPDDAGWRRFTAANLRLLKSAALVAISGTLPPGAPEGLYARFAGEAEKLGVPLVIDSHGPGMLAVLPFHPLVAKMNLHELRKTFGEECGDEPSAVAAAARLVSGGATWALITNGHEPGWLVGGGGRRVWRVTPPRLEKAVNPIGSGDSVTAGLVAAWADGHPMEEAARFAAACGTANAANLLPADFTLQEALKYTRRAKVEPIG